MFFNCFTIGIEASNLSPEKPAPQPIYTFFVSLNWINYVYLIDNLFKGNSIFITYQILNYPILFKLKRNVKCQKLQ